jgi:IrrE N-terminal-like domain
MESFSAVKNKVEALSLPQIMFMRQGDAYQSCNCQERQSILLNSTKEVFRYRFQLVHQLALLCGAGHRIDFRSRTTEKLTKVRRCWGADLIGEGVLRSPGTPPSTDLNASGSQRLRGSLLHDY